MRKLLIALSGVAASVLLVTGLPGSAAAAGGEVTPPSRSWSFDGPFGTFDRAAAQRGFQIYKEVCSSCHSLKYLSYRDLADLGYTEAQVKAIAAGYQVTDGPNKEGEMFQRPGRASDHFVSPFANDEAARAAFDGALPPDLSLMAKARPHGPDYIAALLQGYRDPPAGETVPENRHYNLYFPGNRLAMPPPLTAEQVTYTDGTKATLDQEASDVATFLMWAAEPKLEERHRVGLKVVLFLVVLATVFYLVKRRVWADVH